MYPKKADTACMQILCFIRYLSGDPSHIFSPNFLWEYMMLFKVYRYMFSNRVLSTPLIFGSNFTYSNRNSTKEMRTIPDVSLDWNKNDPLHNLKR